jgi:hypothetical protein
MPVEELKRLVASGSVRAPAYFNGRLLSAGDLRSERDAGRELLARVARGVGAGVAFGFEVSVAPVGAGTTRRNVRVRAGLALGPYGDLLQLDTDIELNVMTVPAPVPVGTTGTAGFRRCQPPPTGTTTVTNPGFHLLAVGPASGSDGSVATSSLGANAVTCALKDDISGLRFVMLPFRLALETKLRADASTAAGDAGTQARLRSRVAGACFGPGPVFPPAPGLPGAEVPTFGALATVTDPALPACHVPLALVSVSNGGIDFVDVWAARRGLAAPSAGGTWGPWLSARARTEAEAMTLAFQDQIEGLVGSLPNPDLIAAEEWFAWLPSVGTVPVRGVGGSVGVDFLRFFRALAARAPTYIPLGLVPTLFDEALRCPPTPLGGKEKPLVYLYRVRENFQPHAFGQPNPPRPVMMFASGFARFLGDGRYDVSQWDFGNFA